MLNVFYGDMQGMIYNTSVYFKNMYDRQWLEDEQVKAMIADIDSSKVLSSGAIDSPVMGVIPPTSLSGGVKTLILIDKMPEKIFNASNCGDNCAAWLLKISKDKDVTVNLRHLMNFGKGTFDIKILNTNQVVHSMQELVPIAGRYV